METSRFFVANLPTGTKEKDLKHIFQDYGEVTRVELKMKENQVEGSVKVLAFVTIKVNECDVQYCLDNLNWQKLHGSQLRVSLAKESFLDRLKREREESALAAAPAPKTSDHGAEPIQQNLLNTRKTFDENAPSDDDDDGISPDLLITKKRAASSLHNGKIVIQNYETAPLHVIETKKTAKKLDPKSVDADNKRKLSLNQKKQQYQQKKSAIQSALSAPDVVSAKKIKFSDNESEEETEKNITTTSKTNIFGSEDEGDDETFDLKPEYFGKKGEKLLQMQSQQSLDPRFKIDSKFVENDDDEEGEDEQEANTNEGEENERDWQMGILEQVVGTKVDAKKVQKQKKMLRFDPAKDEHQVLLRPKAAEADLADKPKKQQKKKGKLKEDAEKTAEDVNPGAEVSKEVFYVVSDTLTESLKTRGDGFSLLNMFGSAASIEEQREDQLKKVSNEKILVNKQDRSNTLNPFVYDSSSEDEDKDANSVEEGKQSQGNRKAGNKLQQETFFIFKNDERLKEGAKFFEFERKEEAPEDYEEVRSRLKMLIRTKISKSKKKINGHKQKKRS